MEYEETSFEEVETLQTDLVENVTTSIEIYSEVTSEPFSDETFSSSDITSEISETVTTYNDSENLQRIADNTDFEIGFLQAFVVAFVMIMIYKFLKMLF